MKSRIIITLICGVIVLFTAVPAVSAAILELDPVSTSAQQGDTFNVELTINTEGESVTSTDAVLLYDNTILQVVNISSGPQGGTPFFPDFFQNITPDEIYIGAAVADPTDTKSGQGVVATITFQGISGGTTDVRFDCTPGKTSDTNISKNDKNATDIVDCSRLTNGRYTIGGPQPTLPPAAPIVVTATPTMPPSGSAGATLSIMSIGILLTLAGIGGKLILKI